MVEVVDLVSSDDEAAAPSAAVPGSAARRRRALDALLAAQAAARARSPSPSPAAPPAAAATRRLPDADADIAAPEARPPKRRRAAPPPPSWAARPDASPSGGAEQQDAGDDSWAPAASDAAAPKPAPAAGKKPRRTREEIAAAAAERRAAREADAAARAARRRLASDRHALGFLRVHLDPRLMETAVGLKIGARLRETHDGPEHERVPYSTAAPLGLGGYAGIKWVRTVDADADAEGGEESEGGGASQPGFLLGGSQPTAAGGGAPVPARAPRLVEREEPHVMVVFEAEAFAAEAERDGLAGLLDALGRHAPAARPHVLVCGLSAHLQRRERADFRAAMAAPGAGGGGFSRAGVDDVVSGLAAACPGLGFRDARDAAEAADHVLRLTLALARGPHRRPDAARWLAAHGAKGGAPLAALLASHPVADAPALTLTKALCALPAVGGQAAHAVAGKYRSLGALMEALVGAPPAAAAAAAAGIEALPRVGAARATRVGPKAARQLRELLGARDPALRVHDAP